MVERLQGEELFSLSFGDDAKRHVLNLIAVGRKKGDRLRRYTPFANLREDRRNRGKKG